jgi:hypothetical protein
MTLEQQVLAVLAAELGPSAPKFLKRQCTYHLKKESSRLTSRDLEDLANWTFIGIKLILSETTAEKVRNNLLSLKG